MSIGMCGMYGGMWYVWHAWHAHGIGMVRYGLACTYVQYGYTCMFQEVKGVIFWAMTELAASEK